MVQYNYYKCDKCEVKAENNGQYPIGWAVIRYFIFTNKLPRVVSSNNENVSYDLCHTCMESFSKIIKDWFK